MQKYDVIIVGGGPTGVAFGIELGLNNINTLILEKHKEPLLSPRAQSLNARSMEFFMRWKLDSELKSKQLLPSEYPVRGVWCSTLNGKTYAISSSNEQLNDNLSPQRGVRIPLWLTEDVLRNKLKEFNCVHFLKQHAVIDVSNQNDHVIVTAENSNGQLKKYSALYVVGCDGANSITRNKAGIAFKQLAKSRRAISVLFESPDLEKHISVEKGFLFYILGSSLPGVIGPIDPVNGLWTAQVGYDGNVESIDQVNIDHLLEELSGIKFSKKIIKAHFWNMHIQLAEHFSQSNRIFLVGDSAHGFTPTGGFGLNTGFGDVVNIGWKLAAVIKKQAESFILATYEQERLSVCLNNLNLAQRNADDMMALKKAYDPKTDPEGFAKGNIEIAKQFAHSLGATMGYAYFNSPLTFLQEHQSTVPMDSSVYEPIAAPGYFLPHVWVENGKSIYGVVSETNWTLIVSGEHNSQLTQQWQDKFSEHNIKLDIVCIKENSYSFKFVLIRPDWHIAFSGNELSNDYINEGINLFYKKSNKKGSSL